jgi:hypothetical protein
VSSRSKARVRRSSSWALVSRDGVQGMGDSTISCQTENTGVNTLLQLSKFAILEYSENQVKTSHGRTIPGHFYVAEKSIKASYE